FAHWTAAPVNGTQLGQNLPDLWSSDAYSQGFIFPDFYVGKEVSEYFGWCHACQRNGLLSAVSLDINIGPFTVSLVDVVYPNPA
ncbi:MAG: hypothetical protein J7M40_10360, partial [Planctomycetes bacterium]|nr:hypothetical protein [Planctomycetota bacterium]